MLNISQTMYGHTILSVGLYMQKYTNIHDHKADSSKVFIYPLKSCWDSLVCPFELQALECFGKLRWSFSGLHLRQAVCPSDFLEFVSVCPSFSF